MYIINRNQTEDLHQGRFAKVKFDMTSIELWAVGLKQTNKHRTHKYTNADR